MACKVETRQIEGSNYVVTQMPPLAALRMQAKLLKMLAPGLGKLDMKADMKSEDMVGVFGAIVANMNEDEAVATVVELCKCAAKDGTKITNFDIAFSDCPVGTPLKVAAFVLEVNYKDFFDGLRSSPLMARVSATK
jgi:hypothetical protein